MIKSLKQIKSSPDYHDYDHEYQDIHEEDIDDWVNSPKQEYRVDNKVILKAKGDSATRTVTEILDPSCELKVGDSVNDFSSNKDYLDDVYNGNFVITSAKSEEEFEDVIIQIEDVLDVNVEHGNIFNINSEIDEDTEYKIDDICRQHNCKFVPVNGSRRQYRLIQSSRRNNMIKSRWENNRNDNVRVIHDLTLDELENEICSYLASVPGKIVEIQSREPDMCAYGTHSEIGRTITYWDVFNGPNFIGNDSNSIGPYGASDFYDDEDFESDVTVFIDYDKEPGTYLIRIE